MPGRLLIFCLFFCLAASVASAQTDETPPAATSALVNGNILTITYDETLDTDSVPPVSSFRVRANPEPGRYTPMKVEGVGISGSTVTLTLVATVEAGETVTVDYSVSETGRIQDSAGNQAAGFSNLAVGNNSPARPDPFPLPSPSPGSVGDYIDDMVEACRTFINAAGERDR